MVNVHIPLSIKCLWAIGGAAEQMQASVFVAFSALYYTQVKGLPGALYGASAFIALMVDAIIDPAIGCYSDGFKSRFFGRRHLFMYLSSIPYALSLFFFLNCPTTTNSGTFMWLTVCMVVIRISISSFVIPCLSLGVEMAKCGESRTRLMAMYAIPSFTVGPLVVIFSYLAFLGDKGAEIRPGVFEYNNGLLNPSNYLGVAFSFGIASFIFTVVPAVGTHRLIPQLLQMPTQNGGFWYRLKKEIALIWDVLKIKSVFLLAVGCVLFQLGWGAAEIFGTLNGVYFWQVQPHQQAPFPLAYPVAGLYGGFLVPKLVKRFDKPRLVTMALALFAFNLTFLYIGRVIGLFRDASHPFTYASLIFFGYVNPCCVVTCSINLNSMIGDIADEVELLKGSRREGVLYSLRMLFSKTASAVGHFMAGIALDIISFQARSKPGTVPKATIYKLGFLGGPFIAIIMLLSTLPFIWYPLTRRRNDEILAQLSESRLLRKQRGNHEDHADVEIFCEDSLSL